MASTRRRFLQSLSGLGLASQVAAQQDHSLRITAVEAVPVNLRPGNNQGDLPKFDGPYDPQRWRYIGPFGQLSGALAVTIRTNQGVVGYGLGAGGSAGAQIVEKHLRHLLVGMNPLDIELLWEQMYASGLSYGRRGIFVTALSAVDNALWDVVGKRLEQPVYRLLGGATKEKAEAYYTSAKPESGLSMGFQNFKLPIRDGVLEGRAGMERTTAILREARQAIGADKRLMIDVLFKWDDLNYVKEMALRLEDVQLYFIEEALSPDDLLGYAELVRDIRSTLIAHGEHEYTQHGYKLLFHHKAAGVAQPDVTWCGGVTAARKIGVMAAEHDVVFLPHRGGSLYGLPLVLTSSHAPMAESFGTGEPVSDLMLAMTAPFEKGYYLPPEKPGFGTEVTDALIQKNRKDV
ncbi:MAG: L-rhamnonate dehydratase [Acidobacteria bacterium]|nr:L-rhamnonate dehydratase [Acidobacteriota bacterium]